MKIAIMVNRLTGGGAERVAALWATGFAEKGHEVSVVVNSLAASDTTYFIPASVKCYSLGINVGHPLLRTILNKVRYLFKPRQKVMNEVLHQIQPDLIICVLHRWVWEVKQSSNDLKAKIINTEHNSFERPPCAPMPSYLVKAKFETNKICDHVTVLTQADMNVIGNTLSNVTVLPNPLTFMPVNEVPSKQKIILSVGRLDAWECKGFDILIKAFSLICKQYDDWVLQIAGTGKTTSFQYLQDLAKDIGIPQRQIEFLGFQNDIQLLYRRSSIFVLSSRYEGFGMVLIEAMSQGCACIACDYKGRQSEIIMDETQGITCPVEDVETLAFNMEKMIEDEKYRKQCQLNAIERSKYYSLENTMDRWEEILKKINL